jgi:hypothetical protein
MKTATGLFALALAVIFATLSLLGLLHAISIETQRLAIGVSSAIIIAAIAAIVIETRRVSRR